MRIYDISRPISTTTEVFPDDRPFVLHNQSNIANSGYNLSWFEMSAHLGTHIDAPAHFIPGGKTIDQLDPALFFGPALIIDCTNCSDAITPADLKPFLHDNPCRVLLKTNNTGKYLLPETAQLLITGNCKLLGIDQLCLDRPDDLNYTIHKTLLGAGLVIVEALNLTNIQPGPYTYSGAPLNLLAAEAAPVRPFLITE